MDNTADARQQSIRARADLLAASQDRESRQAQAMIDAFVVQAKAQQLPIVELPARTLSGRRVRTNLRGWFLRNDHSAAVGVDGRYYQLTIPGDWLTPIRGVHLSPSPPPLVLGRGGKDGEAIDLADALKRTLAGQVT